MDGSTRVLKVAAPNAPNALKATFNVIIQYSMLHFYPEEPGEGEEMYSKDGKRALQRFYVFGEYPEWGNWTRVQ
jgi:hypothetical protein